MSETNGTDKKNISLAQLPGGSSVWLSRVAGGGIGGLFLGAVIICLPSINTYFADSKEIRILEIKTSIDQCNQQLLSCISDLKEARSDLRECRK